MAAPDRAAAVKPVPFPMSTCVLVTAFGESTPELFASRTITVLADALATFARDTAASAICAVSIEPPA